MIVYNKIVVSTIEPKEKIVLWYDPSKQDIFWYNDGWTSLTIMPDNKSLKHDIKQVKELIESLPKDYKELEQVIIQFDNFKEELSTTQDSLDQVKEQIENINVSTEEDIVTNVKCGALEPGATIAANTSFTEIIRMLTTKVLLASRQTSPSATIISTIATNTTKEVGETIAPTLTATFNDGEFNSYAAGAIATETIDAGCTATAYQILRGTTVISSSSTYTDSYKLTNGNTTYTCKITHSASASDIPTNSDGSVNTDVQFSSDTVTSGSITIIGAYKYFYGSADSLPENVRELTSNFRRPSSVNMTGTKWFLYVPKTSPQPTSFKTLLEAYTIEDENDSNQDKTGVILKKEVTVQDAGGSDVDYYRYMMQLDNALGSNINIS